MNNELPSESLYKDFIMTNGIESQLDWEDISYPTEGSTPAGNVGAPIGNGLLPILFGIFIIYLTLKKRIKR